MQSNQGKDHDYKYKVIQQLSFQLFQYKVAVSLTMNR